MTEIFWNYFISIIFDVNSYSFYYFSLLVGQGAHKYAVDNNIVAVNPCNLISGKIIKIFCFNNIYE